MNFMYFIYLKLIQNFVLYKLIFRLYHITYLVFNININIIKNKNKNENTN